MKTIGRFLILTSIMLISAVVLVKFVHMRESHEHFGSLEDILVLVLFVLLVCDPIYRSSTEMTDDIIEKIIKFKNERRTK